MSPTKEKRGRGRPKKPASELVSAPMNFKAPWPLRDKIDIAAKASGRSRAAEITYRLERSFDDVELIGQLARYLKQELEKS